MIQLRDGQVVSALIAEIENQLTIYGLADFVVSRADQPTNQYSGAYGGSEKHQVYIAQTTGDDAGAGWDYSTSTQTEMDINYRVVRESSYQISALVDFDFTDPDAIPADELISVIRDTIRQNDAIKNLKEKGVFIESASSPRPVFSVNGQDRYESMPNFDLRVTYNAKYTKKIGAVNSARGEVHIANLSP